VTAKTFADWLSGDRQPMGKSLEKLRKFLDAKAKRNIGDGIKPTERVPFKIVLPVKQLRYARLCPFCRKARGKIQSISRAAIPGYLPEMWSDWTEARGTPGSLASLEWERVLNSPGWIASPISGF
jgi:hypothetical protein